MVTARQRKEFGEYIRGLREACGKSLRQVQRETGGSPAYLSLIEKGERNPPQPDLLRKLANCYGVAPAELLRHAGYLEPEDAAAQDDEQADLLWAYRAVMKDPYYRSGHSLTEEAPPEVMRFVVEMYERFTGKRLLGRKKSDTGEGGES